MHEFELLSNYDYCFSLSLFAELNSVMRKHQGDFDGSRSANELGREYMAFFTNEVDDALQAVQDQDKNAAREQLCSIFQVTIPSCY